MTDDKDIRYIRKINSLILVDDSTIVIVKCIPEHKNTGKRSIPKALQRIKCKVCAAYGKRNFDKYCSDIIICGAGWCKRPDKLQVVVFKIRRY